MRLRSAVIGSLLAVSTSCSGLLALAEDAQPSANTPILLSKPSSGTGVGDSVFNKLDDPFKTSASVPANSSAPMPAPRMPAYRPADDSKNWMLMTPEEILGVKTADDILGVKSDKDASLTQEQKFLKRQQPAQTSQIDLNNTGNNDNNNNPNGPLNLRSWTDSSGNTVNASDPNHSGVGPFQTLGGLLDDRQNGGALYQLSQNSVFGNSANASAPSAAQLAKQKADMDAFRVLLGEKPDDRSANANNPNLNPSLSYRPKASDNDDSDPLASRNGVGLKPLSDQYTKPVGLTQPSVFSHPIKKNNQPPAWAPKPPPWLSQGPSLDGVPQRKF